MSPLGVLLVAVTGAGQADPAEINLVPQPVVRESTVEWDFEKDTENWQAERNCTVSAAEGSLRITATAHDPYMHCPVRLPGGEFLFEIRARGRGAGAGAIYWTTDRSPRRGEDKVTSFPLTHDGQWHESSTRFLAPGTLTDLRIDPGGDAGEIEIDWIRLTRHIPHPIVIERIETTGPAVRVTLRNQSDARVEFSALGQTHSADAGATVRLERVSSRENPIEPVFVEVAVDGFPPVERRLFLHHEDVETEWIERSSGDLSLQVARDGTVARIRRAGKLVAAFAPIVHCEGVLPSLAPVGEREPGPSVRLAGDGITLTLRLEDGEIEVALSSERECEGPVVRAVGGLEQGIFSGLEYLGRGERSSSKLDVETDEHLRFSPDPLKVTMPLMSFVTDRASVAMTWTDMGLQPTYATPNFVDASADHRMSLVGKKIDATIRIDRVPAEETIHWAIGELGLPPLPEPPRSEAEQWALCMKALNGPLRTEAGWGHCVEDRWKRSPSADMASTVWRLTGEVPDFPQFVPGGAHVRNDSIFFVTGAASRWKQSWAGQVERALRAQQADGSFRYSGKFARGHFEDTASGVCARPAMVLLEYARFTGDEAALAAGVRALEFIKRFRTPRGAQVWEVPLHTPDQLASAYLVWAYVRGYELTGDEVYLEQARKWALSGVPFVYLWGKHPIMLYATPPVFGATSWRAPCWIGLPVQWVGGVYAYALAMLAPYDDSVDWNHLARGILLSAEQQQYPDGEYVGLLPDSVVLSTQERRPWRINPCALVSLRFALDGRLDSLDVATGQGHRVVSPFPATIRGGQVHVDAKKGTSYQILIDNERTVDVLSQGHDMVPLDP